MITLDTIKKEAGVLQLRLEKGSLNINELASFLSRVKEIPSSYTKANVSKSDNRMANALNKLDRTYTRKQQ